jgi:hypothetical protein
MLASCATSSTESDLPSAQPGRRASGSRRPPSLLAPARSRTSGTRNRHGSPCRIGTAASARQGAGVRRLLREGLRKGRPGSSALSQSGSRGSHPADSRRSCIPRRTSISPLSETDLQRAETGQPGCRAVMDATGLTQRDTGRRRFRGPGLSRRVRAGALEGGTPDGVLFGRLTARTRRALAKGPDHAHQVTAVRQRA